MLDAALSTVNRLGLTVSLEHISLEDVIREAGVSRSAVYRRWPYKDMFFSDLLRALARAVAPAQVPDARPALDQVRAVVRERPELLRTPQGRHTLAVEMLRVGNLTDLAAMAESTAWRTYMALHATYLSLDDGELRDEIGESLAASERALMRRTAENFGAYLSLMGYRIRPELNADAETVIAVTMPLVRGAIIMAPAAPEITARSVHANPFGASGEAEWSPVAVAMASISLTYIEPDPAIEWDDERVEQVRQTFEAPAELGDEVPSE
ncbi:MAG: TetR/AcrR family transcriptional regulator [Actinomycetia bacterium]|nr:TetR/AcrR family transcriptional regulator [Actinomycetes bacterium]